MLVDKGRAREGAESRSGNPKSVVGNPDHPGGSKLRVPTSSQHSKMITET
jgi:hypothetical protein